MPLKLILIRHAKSAWDDPHADDHARVLNKRGRVSAASIGEWLAREGHVPDLIISSDSTRTRETVELIRKRLPIDPEVRFRRSLYHAGAGVLMDALMGADAEAVALVAHNPGIGTFAQQIVAEPATHPRFVDYPTAATLVVEFDAQVWGEINWREGRVIDFITPHDLT